MTTYSFTLSGIGVFDTYAEDEYGYVEARPDLAYAYASLLPSAVALPPNYTPAGAPGASAGAVSPIVFSHTFDVEVIEQALINSGDSQATSQLVPSFADNRGAGPQWQAMEAVYTADEIPSTVVLAAGETSAQLLISGLLANLPSTANILGIQVEIDRRVLQGSVASDALNSVACGFVAPPTDYTSDTYLQDERLGEFTWNAGGQYWESNTNHSTFSRDLGVVGNELGWVVGLGQPTQVDVDVTMLAGNPDAFSTYVIFWVYPSGSSTPVARASTPVQDFDSEVTPFPDTKTFSISSIPWLAGDRFAGITFYPGGFESFFDTRISNLVFTA